MFELRQLRYFVAVAETEHVGRAAAALGISQPPLSRQIQQLEDRLGLSLFARRKQRLRLTHSGKLFLNSARELLAHAQRVEQEALRAAQGGGGVLHVGAVEGALHAEHIQQALVAFRERRPKVAVALRLLRSSALIEALRHGELDVGYAYRGAPADDPDLSSTLLAEERFVLALPSSHALVGSTCIEPAQLAREVFVGPPSTTHAAARSELLEACQRAGWALDIRYEASEPSTVLSFVRAGLGLALVQASCATRADDRVTFRTLDWLPLRVRVHLTWQHESSSKLALEYLRLARQAARGKLPA